MKNKIIKSLVVFGLFLTCISVNATIKCDSGKPGDIINCVVTNGSYSGTTSRIKADAGLTFESCDVCSGDSYTLVENVAANFKFKIDANINENKSLNVSIAGESATVKIEVSEEDNTDEVTYTVTLVPGKNQSNITKSCKVNSLNTTCNVELEELSLDGFNGWGQNKECIEGSKGNIKVNKDITYYACYKSSSVSDGNTDTNNDLLLKSLVIKNGDEEIDLDFSIRIKEYEITVPVDTENLVVDAVAQDENVKVSVTGNDSLDEDNNEIIITLTDKDKKTNSYTVKVTKSDEVKLPLLSNLIVGGYNLQFNPETFNYNLTIDVGIKELSIEPDVETNDFDVKVNGNENLKNGSRINIVVTDKNTAATSTYVITISQENTDLIMYIGIGAGVLLILIILLIIVIKKGKKNNNVEKNKPNIQNKGKGKVVNNNINIPEVKPTVPVAPIANNENNSKDELEVLDL